ncbi:MAG: hypothetical protein K2N23_05875 [Clostridia bacterium]|nr:hypothetical protein [Clostridia bacterium]
MAEETIMDNQPETQPENKPSAGAKFKAALKEWCRKRIVALKVKPQLIPLLLMAITTVYFMLILFNVSKAVYEAKNATDITYATGICTFITTLLSLLYLVSFLNAFPKRKKPNIFFIVLVGVMIAGQIACDVVYYLQMAKCITEKTSLAPVIKPAQPMVLAHIVLLGVSAIVFALLPVYSKLIRKINTSVKLDSATEHMHGKIDIEEDD